MKFFRKVMKIIKLDENFNINFGALIDESSEIIKDELKFEKYFDVYNYETGVDYENYFNSQDKEEAMLTLQENIIQNILNIPYVINVSYLNIKNNDDILVIDLNVKYIDNNNIKDTTLSVSENGFK